MIGKPITGKSFGGCVRYLVNREEATIIEIDGLRLQSARTITLDFNQQRKLNPALGKAVGHTILSWSAEDAGKLTDESMVSVAKEYMEKMGIRNTQYMIVRHTDRTHPHVHIVYNRVDYQGNTITDNNNYKRNVLACKQLTEQYGYYFAKGKDQVNRQQLKGRDLVRYAIYDHLKHALKTAGTWDELAALLQQNGIGIHYKYKGETIEIQGISFSKDGLQYKGSAIDRAMSFTRIESQLQRNKQSQSQAKVAVINSGKEHKHPKNSRPTGFQNTSDTGRNLLEILLHNDADSNAYNPFEQDLPREKRKKKSKRKGI